MTLGSYSTIDQMKRSKTQIKDYQEFNWDVVTIPVDPKNPDVTTNGFGLYELFAVNAQSTEQRAAWEFVKYLNSDDFARVMSRSTQQLLSRTSYIKEMEGHNLNAFFKLKADTNPYQDYAKIPPMFYQTIMQLIDNEMKPVLEGKKSLDEVMPLIQSKAQEAMEKAKVEQKSQKETAVPGVSVDSAVASEAVAN
ncbi:unnamed protein product [Aphanomyces euteiches]